MCGTLELTGNNRWPAWVAGFDLHNGLIWQESVGDGASLYGIHFEPNDGLFVAAGSRSDRAQGWQGFVVEGRVDDGAVLWKRGYGGARSDVFRDVRLSSDGVGLVSAGGTESFGLGTNDVLLIETDRRGGLRPDLETDCCTFGEAPTNGALEPTNADEEVTAAGEVFWLVPPPPANLTMTRIAP